MSNELQVGRGQQDGTAPMQQQDTEEQISEICLVTVAQLTNAFGSACRSKRVNAVAVLLMVQHDMQKHCIALELTHLLLPAPATSPSASSTSPHASTPHATHRCMAYHNNCYSSQLHSLLPVTVTGSNRTVMVAAESDIFTADQLQWHSLDIECDSWEVARAAAMQGRLQKQLTPCRLHTGCIDCCLTTPCRIVLIAFCCLLKEHAECTHLP